MASVRRKPGTQFWFACFTDSAGIQRQRSTKTTNRKTAQKMAEGFEDAYRSRQTEFQLRRILSDIHQDLHGKPMEEMTAAKYKTKWLKRKAGETARTTYKTYEAAVGDFITFLGKEADAPLLTITRRHVEDWRNRIAGQTTPNTANNKLKVLRAFFSSAHSDEFITDNPAAKIRILKQIATIRRGFTMEEVQALIASASSEWRGMILFGFYTGQRLKDIATCTWENINLERKTLLFKTSKTERNMSIPISSPLAAWLQENRPAKATGFVFKKAGDVVQRTGTTGQLSDEFFDLLAKINLVDARTRGNPSKGIGRNSKRHRNAVSFHSLRHTTTSLLKQAGVGDAIARDIIGHDTVEISREYTHIDEKSKRGAIDLLPDITK